MFSPFSFFDVDFFKMMKYYHILINTRLFFELFFYSYAYESNSECSSFYSVIKNLDHCYIGCYTTSHVKNVFIYHRDNSILNLCPVLTIIFSEIRSMRYINGKKIRCYSLSYNVRRFIFLAIVSICALRALLAM